MSPNLEPVTIDPAAIFLPPTQPIDITALIAAEPRHHDASDRRQSPADR